MGNAPVLRNVSKKTSKSAKPSNLRDKRTKTAGKPEKLDRSRPKKRSKRWKASWRKLMKLPKWQTLLQPGRRFGPWFGIQAHQQGHRRDLGQPKEGGDGHLYLQLRHLPRLRQEGR